jgi:hypothetical protein
MANDTFVYFKRGRNPTQEEIGLVLDDYTLHLATSPPRWEKDRFFVDLHGTCRHPFARVLPPEDAHLWKQFEEEPRPRWIEVWIGDEGKTIDVMTRNSDAVTNDIARGFAARIAMYWDGDVED